MEIMLEKSSGDIIQAIQALKESRPEPTNKLQVILVELQETLADCQTYTRAIGVHCPFLRARRQVEDALVVLYPEVSNWHFGGALVSYLDTTVDHPSSAVIERVQLGPLTVPRLFNGLWQLSSPAWGSASCHKQDAELLKMVRAGLVAGDMADHYVSLLSSKVTPKAHTDISTGRCRAHLWVFPESTLPSNV